jgi:hypothetical protein
LSALSAFVGIRAPRAPRRYSTTRGISERTSRGGIIRTLKSLSLAFIATAALALAAPVRASDEPSLADILRQATTYVQQFEHDFAMVISEETYDQDDRRAKRSRELHSEMLFLQAADERTWLAVRNVLSVTDDDKTRRIADADRRLERLLNDPTLRQVRRIADEGARFNLGRIRRNVNDPTLVLRFLDPTYQPRFAFKLAGQETVNGVDAWRLTFVERQRPTVIVSDEDVFSTGAVWVSKADGAVLRTSLLMSPPHLKASITVEYGRDAKLAMWVPSRMEEIYTQSHPDESIACIARYANFRRFETSSRVVPPQ